MPYVIDSDPDGEWIEKIRKGEATEIPVVPLAGTDWQVFRRFALRYEPTDAEPGWRMIFDATEGVPRCVSFSIDTTTAGREVRTTDLRSISVEDELEKAARLATFPNTPLSYRDDVLSGASLRAVRAARSTTRRRVTDDVLRQVAEIYRREADDRPVEAIASHLGVALRTAGLYVRRARDAGFLGEAVRGKAGER